MKYCQLITKYLFSYLKVVLEKVIKEKISKIKCFEKYKQTKSIDIVFSGTLPGEIIKPWENNEDYPFQTS